MSNPNDSKILKMYDYFRNTNNIRYDTQLEDRVIVGLNKPKQSGYNSFNSPIPIVPAEEVSNEPAAGITEWTLTGTLFDDTNQDSIMDGGEPTLGAGHTVYLFGITDAEFFEQIITGADGIYTFTNLPEGTYMIDFLLTGVWSATFPLQDLEAIVLSVATSPTGTTTLNWGWTNDPQ